MGIGEAPDHAAGDEHRHFDRKETPFLGQLLAELFKIDAADQLHRNVENAFGFPKMVGLDDVGMDQIGDQLGFANEIGDEFLVVGIVLADNLDRHPFDEIPRALLLGFVNDAHAAFKNLADDVVSQIAIYGEKCAHRRRKCPNCIESQGRSLLKPSESRVLWKLRCDSGASLCRPVSPIPKGLHHSAHKSKNPSETRAGPNNSFVGIVKSAALYSM